MRFASITTGTSGRRISGSVTMVLPSSASSTNSLRSSMLTSSATSRAIGSSGQSPNNNIHNQNHNRRSSSASSSASSGIFSVWDDDQKYEKHRQQQEEDRKIMMVVVFLAICMFTVWHFYFSSSAILPSSGIHLEMAALDPLSSSEADASASASEFASLYESNPLKQLRRNGPKKYNQALLEEDDRENEEAGRDSLLQNTHQHQHHHHLHHRDGNAEEIQQQRQEDLPPLPKENLDETMAHHIEELKKYKEHANDKDHQKQLLKEEMEEGFKEEYPGD